MRDLSNPGVTISAGVSHWVKGQWDNVKEVVKRADEALYLAKNSGMTGYMHMEYDNGKGSRHVLPLPFTL
ncbi:hypothetical protein SRABI96_00098 [Peribacillus sp. Bi96]|uniref:diguanylate cyclase domain-containing protein n=1 Tax=unclassified Peribacillus TaxID=2675266 RepID=UPI001D8C2B43|nr:diguanylate cyclase [Peribacillus sp. Bi96]CAH0126589.1 hypothetical protein SRABI96_00098 [Peribacillus sp. Bi96]